MREIAACAQIHNKCRVDHDRGLSMATKKAAKRPSGPSGKNLQRGMMVREGRPGQFDEWREAAEADGRKLAGWLRHQLDQAVAKWRRSKQQR
jgi:hypothetical protein